MLVNGVVYLRVTIRAPIIINGRLLIIRSLVSVRRCRNAVCYGCSNNIRKLMNVCFELKVCAFEWCDHGSRFDMVAGKVFLLGEL